MKYLRTYLLTSIGCVLLAAALNLFMINPAAAGTDDAVVLEISGEGVSTPMQFTRAQLQAMEQYQHVYSTINTWPTKKWYVAKGIRLRDLLIMAGIKENARLINIKSEDGYTVTLTVKELLQDQRYCFPHFMDNSAHDGSIPGSAADAEEVEPVLALWSAEGSDQPDDMNDMHALLFICGQRAVTEQTNTMFLRYTNKIEVLTTQPPQWDKPRANIASGEVAMGTLIELSNKSSDADKIYYTTDGSTPTVNSPIFNWSAKRWWSQRPDSLQSVNKPIEIMKNTVIKAVTIGPGKTDSEVVTFSYRPNSMIKSNHRGDSGRGTDRLSLDEDLIELQVGGTCLLSAILDSGTGVSQHLLWESSDNRVATVDAHGLVTAVGPGETVITASTGNGDLSAECIIKASQPGNPLQAAHSGSGGWPADNIQTDNSPNVADGNEPPPAKPDREASQADELAKAPIDEAAMAHNQEYLITADRSAASTFSNHALQPQPANQVLEVFPAAQSLPWQENTNKKDTILLAAVFWLLFLTGATGRYWIYLREVKR